MSSANQVRAPGNQRGTVLLVAIVILLLASIATVFALNVGIFETRSTANDARAKMVNEVAEAGLSEGFEFLMRQHSDWLDDPARWEQCVDTDTTFPCGAVPQFEPDGTTPRRATMYRFIGGNDIQGIDDNLDVHMLTMPNKLATVGGFNVSYGVAPVLCRVARPLPTEPANTPVRCATDPTNANKLRIATFVAVGAIPGESAKATLTQTVGLYSILQNGPEVPPILASGSVDLTGTLQVVTNPNSGGPGVPVSIWTRRDVVKHGTPNTCYADEFFRYGDKHGDAQWVGTNVRTTVCDTCECSGDKSLSFDKSGNQIDEGIDILDIDGNTAGGNAQQANRDVRLNMNEFPCDLFDYVFGVKTWQDNNSDYFCETRRPRISYTPDWNPSLQESVYPDEAYLYANAAHIVVDTNNAQAVRVTAGSDKIVTAGYLDQNAAGMIWCQPGCDIGSGAVVGSPDHPVLLVIDGSARIQGRVFGMVFLRTSTAGPLDASTGGTAVLDMNAGATVYGAVVVQGSVDKANGNAAVVYNGDILNRLATDPAGNRYATLPGAWTDLRSY
ncbi:hypothetical protein [Lysobacter sp. P5_B9]